MWSQACPYYIERFHCNPVVLDEQVKQVKTGFMLQAHVISAVTIAEESLDRI